MIAPPTGLVTPLEVHPEVQKKPLRAGQSGKALSEVEKIYAKALGKRKKRGALALGHKSNGRLCL